MSKLLCSVSDHDLIGTDTSTTVCMGTTRSARDTEYLTI